MSEYIERYWRDATPEDAIREPAMVARFRDNADNTWSIHKLFYWDRSDDPWVNQSGHGYDRCQVYDAPDPGEGWRLIDTANEKGEVGDEFLTQSGVWLPECRHNGFEHGVPFRRRITPAVTYVPFTWEDREQLRGRWIYRTKDGNIIEEIAFKFDSRVFNAVAKHLLEDGWKFLDTGKPVGKEVAQ